MKAKATKRATTTATRMANGNKGGGQATATRAMAVVTNVVSKYEGSGNGNEGGG